MELGPSWYPDIKENKYYDAARMQRPLYQSHNHTLYLTKSECVQVASFIEDGKYFNAVGASIFLDYLLYRILYNKNDSIIIISNEMVWICGT